MNYYLNNETLEIFFWLLFQKKRPQKVLSIHSVDDTTGEINRYIPSIKMCEDIKKYNLESFFDYDKNEYGLYVDLLNEQGLEQFLRTYLSNFEKDALVFPDIFISKIPFIKHLECMLNVLYYFWEKYANNDFTISSSLLNQGNDEIGAHSELRLFEMLLFLYFSDPRYILINDCRLNSEPNKLFSVDISIKMLKSPNEITKDLTNKFDISSSSNQSTLLDALTNTEKEFAIQ